MAGIGGERLSITDPLTGVYNRRYFMDSVVIQMDIAEIVSQQG